MRTFWIIIFTIAYYAAIIAGGLWFGMKAVALILVACSCLAVVTALIDKDECEEEEEKPEHDSCIGCRWNLGGGCCELNSEDECAAGGGYELWEERK